MINDAGYWHTHCYPCIYELGLDDDEALDFADELLTFLIPASVHRRPATFTSVQTLPPVHQILNLITTTGDDAHSNLSQMSLLSASDGSMEFLVLSFVVAVIAARRPS